MFVQVESELDGITYVRGDACRPIGEDPAIIAHVCNDQGGWGRGFVLAVSRRWPEPKIQYRKLVNDHWPESLPLGEIQIIEVQQIPRQMWVANMIAQAGYVNKKQNVALKYDALELALQHLADQAITMGAQVHMPYIGCGLAGGEWSKVQPLVYNHLIKAGINCTVYSL